MYIYNIILYRPTLLYRVHGNRDFTYSAINTYSHLSSHPVHGILKTLFNGTKHVLVFPAINIHLRV